jgi:hypothetical protein
LDYFIFLKMFAMSHVKQVAFFNGVDKWLLGKIYVCI